MRILLFFLILCTAPAFSTAQSDESLDGLIEHLATVTTPADSLNLLSTILDDYMIGGRDKRINLAWSEARLRLAQARQN